MVCRGGLQLLIGLLSRDGECQRSNTFATPCWNPEEFQQICRTGLIWRLGGWTALTELAARRTRIVDALLGLS